MEFFDFSFQVANPVTTEFWRVAGLCEPVETHMFVTTTVWAQFAAEVSRLKTGGLPNLTPQNFTEVKLGCLLVINSGSDNQDAVDEANKQSAESSHFAWKRDHLSTGKGMPKKARPSIIEPPDAGIP